jgi:hypothetical protein
MTRFIFALLLIFSGSAIAKDDGGFGETRFTSQAPVALGGAISETERAPSGLQDGMADIEPAAGETAKQPTVLLENSDHKTDPYIIQKELEVR